MAKKLAIAVIHGMGWQSPDFAREMTDELNEWVADSGKDPDEIAWKPIFWANIVEPRQKAYLKKANANDELDYMALRRFVISSLGDVSAYQVVKSTHNTTYELIHDRVRERISELDGELDSSDTTPLIVMAHSLGGHIMSNYIWDIQKKPKPGMRPFERMETLAGMVTFGCNIPLFTMAYTNVTPIKFPARQFPPAIRKKARWLNYFDPDDILGYPLKPINAAYGRVVSEDISINVGGLFSSWNPTSHTKYWTDNDFTRPVAEFIAKFL